MVEFNSYRRNHFCLCLTIVVKVKFSGRRNSVQESHILLQNYYTLLLEFETSVLFILDKVSPHSLGWPRKHYGGQVSLDL